MPDERSRLWEELYRRFDPAETPDAAWYADRTHSPIGHIERQLSKGFKDEHRYLLMGTRGTGKTTELLRLSNRRAGDEFVVHVDLVQHFSRVQADLAAMQTVQPWELVGLCGLALFRAAQERLGHRWSSSASSSLNAAWRAALTDTQEGDTGALDITKLAKALIIGASTVAGQPQLALLGGVVEAARFSVPVGRGSRLLTDQDSSVQNMVEVVNQLFREFRAENRRDVLLVLDGLDRIDNEDGAARLFVDSELLGSLDARTVITAPFVLRHSMGAERVRHFEPVTLVNEPVLDKVDPRRHGPGVAFFCELFRRRVMDLDTLASVIETEQLERLAYYSGGHARDFVTLARQAFDAAYDNEVQQLGPAEIDTAIDSSRLKLERGLHRGHLEVLERVAADPDRQLPAADEVWDLLQYRRLLPYPNKSEWFFPHPLLTINLVHVPPTPEPGEPS